jgi:hypothetical protein
LIEDVDWYEHVYEKCLISGSMEILEMMGFIPSYIVLEVGSHRPAGRKSAELLLNLRSEK